MCAVVVAVRWWGAEWSRRCCLLCGCDAFEPRYDDEVAEREVRFARGGPVEVRPNVHSLLDFV
jgi:hypothetical protein